MAAAAFYALGGAHAPIALAEIDLTRYPADVGMMLGCAWADPSLCLAGATP